MKPKLRITLIASGSAALFVGIVIFFAVSAFRPNPAEVKKQEPEIMHVYVVSPGIEVAAVSVFNCSNIGFEDLDKAEKYSRERPGTHVFEVSFKEIR